MCLRVTSSSGDWSTLPLGCGQVNGKKCTRFHGIQGYYNLFFRLVCLAVLGLHSCADFFLVAASRGYSSLPCAGFSLLWLLLLRSTGFRARGLSSWGSAALWHVGSSQTRGRIHVSCVGRWVLYHWATREALSILFFKFTNFAVPPGILVPWPGIKPNPPMMEAQSLNHWTIREVPIGISEIRKIALF